MPALLLVRLMTEIVQACLPHIDTEIVGPVATGTLVVVLLSVAVRALRWAVGR